MARYRSIKFNHDQDGDTSKEHNQVSRRDQTGKGIYWRTPATMVGSTLIGAAFAIAHDRFYQSFNGRPVGGSFQQKLVVNVGTAFAFLVKMFFAIASATAFEQQLWLSLKRRAETINDIDSLFDILSNILNFGKITLWLRHLILAILAVVVWIIPIAAVFTPGTINVQPDVRYHNDTLFKPAQPQQSWINTQNFGQTQLDFTVLWRVGENTYSDVVLNGPTGVLYSVALGSASRRNVLPIPVPNANSSYELSFFAPALSCETLSDSDLSNFEKSVVIARNLTYLAGQNSIEERVENEKVPEGLVLKYNAWVETVTTQYSLSNPNWNNGSADIQYPDQANNQYFYFNSSITNRALLVCHLHNATYDAEFSFQNSQQAINLRSVTLHEPVPYNGTIDVNTPNYANTVYNAIYYAFNNIVIGACTNDTATTSQNVLSYGAPILISALRDFIEGEAELTAPAVISTLQAIFENITLSTLSAPSLRLSDQQAESIRGTTWRAVNVYVYEPNDLYIAYGCALLATSLSVLWGLYLAVWNEHISFSSKFSTIVRTTRRREIDGIVNADARRGDDPLPKEMKEVKFLYSYNPDGERMNDGFVVVDTSGMDVEMHAKGDVADGNRPASGLTFSPQIPDASLSRGGDLEGRQQVRRKPLPSAQTRFSDHGQGAFDELM